MGQIWPLQRATEALNEPSDIERLSAERERPRYGSTQKGKRQTKLEERARESRNKKDTVQTLRGRQDSGRMLERLCVSLESNTSKHKRQYYRNRCCAIIQQKQSHREHNRHDSVITISTAQTNSTVFCMLDDAGSVPRCLYLAIGCLA